MCKSSEKVIGSQIGCFRSLDSDFKVMQALYCLFLAFGESCNFSEICNDNRTTEFSGSNEAELNKVIDHYSCGDAGSAC